MPELPEVETTRTHLYPHLINRNVRQVVIRDKRLRYRVRNDLPSILKGRKIISLTRRGKYIIIHFVHGNLLVHLGMSGSLRLIDKKSPLQKHDHIDLVFGHCLVRFNDPRRFGCFLWEGKKDKTSVLAGLGYEPLEKTFNRDSLYKITSKSKMPIKSLLMTNHYLVGVGNIYANESLWLARISPFRLSNQLSLSDCDKLVACIKRVLRAALKAGGTRIRNYQVADGDIGYFHLKLNAYGKSQCPRCSSPIFRQLLGQRATFFCPSCQK